MVVEAGLAGSPLVLVLPPAGERHQHDSRSERFADLRRRLVAVHARHADVEEGDLRPDAGGERHRDSGRPAATRDVVAVEREHQPHHLGGIGDVVGDEHAAGARGRAVAAGRCVADGCGVRRGSGSVTVNTLPRPGPSLRASMVPPCSSTRRRASVRPMPRPPCAAVAMPWELREHVEDARQHVRRDADAGVLHAQDDAAAAGVRA